MKKFCYISVLLLVVCVISSCGKDGSFLKLTNTSKNITLKSMNETTSLSIESNRKWNITTDAAEWLSINPLEGEGNRLVTVVSKQNKTAKKRSGKIIISSNDKKELIQIVTITQDFSILEINGEDEMTMGNGGDNIVLDIKSNISWKITTPGSDWIKIPAANSGQGNKVVSIEVLPNISGKDRNSYIVVSGIKDASFSDTVKIIQHFTNFIVDGTVVQIQKSTKTKAPNLIIMGDGYNFEDVNTTKKYDKEIKEACDAFFSTEPLKTLKEKFNIYKVYATSKEGGASYDNKSKKSKKETVFSATFLEGVAIKADYDQVKKYAKKITGITDETLKNSAVIVIINENNYGGICQMWSDGVTISLCPVSRQGAIESTTYFYSLILHEGAGHGWGHLADEYIADKGNGKTITDKDKKDLLDWQGWNFFKNVTTDKNNAPWKSVIGKPGYERVGLHEGGNYYTKGVWRCEKTNCMINNMHYFSFYCRYLQAKRVMDIIGEPFDLQKFMTMDKVKAPTKSKSYIYPEEEFIPLPPPVLVEL